MKNIILLSGYSGSGKSYIADIFQSRGWLSLALADQLKDEVSVQYSIPRDELDTQEGKRKQYYTGQTHRDILIHESKKKKQKDINYFAKKIIEKIRTNNYSQHIVISDMRFPHEYYHIKTKLPEYNVISVRVKRDIYNVIDDYSEKALDDFLFDITIYNDNTLMKQLETIISR